MLSIKLPRKLAKLSHKCPNPCSRFDIEYLLFKSQRSSTLVRNEGGGVGDDRHKDKHEDRPGPRVCFAADNGERGHTLHRQNEKHHQRKSRQRRPDGFAIVVFGIANRRYQRLGFLVLVFAYVVDDRKRRD